MITSVLARYPRHIGEAAVHHLATSSKWLPTVSEVREECERRIMAEQNASDRAAQLEQQLQDRRDYQAARERSRHSDAEIKAIVEAMTMRNAQAIERRAYEPPTDDQLRKIYARSG